MEQIEWTKDRVKELKLKMGWSTTEFARHLDVELKTIQSIEDGNYSELESITSLLTLYWYQAENFSEEVFLSALAEQELDNLKSNQLYNSELKDKYFK